MSDQAMMHRSSLVRRGTNLVAKSASAGFTLLELMVVVAIVAILAAIALPSYNSSIIKTNRRAAEACLSQYANYMERYYTTNMSYAKDLAGNANTTLPALDCAGASQTGNRYGYRLTGVTANAYVVQANPSGAQLTGDTLCGTLTLNQAGLRTISGSGTLSQCW